MTLQLLRLNPKLMVVDKRIDSQLNPKFHQHKHFSPIIRNHKVPSSQNPMARGMRKQKKKTHRHHHKPLIPLHPLLPRQQHPPHNRKRLAIKPTPVLQLITQHIHHLRDIRFTNHIPLSQHHSYISKSKGTRIPYLPPPQFETYRQILRLNQHIPLPLPRRNRPKQQIHLPLHPLWNTNQRSHIISTLPNRGPEVLRQDRRDR
ncbi:hypothetical protein DFH27DRAFT_538527 [Peziza echinospora]|nr:hypothetical protein DFH27DRAFT_538527 [Peziza echinospora]